MTIYSEYKLKSNKKQGSLKGGKTNQKGQMQKEFERVIPFNPNIVTNFLTRQSLLWTEVIPLVQ